MYDNDVIFDNFEYGEAGTIGRAHESADEEENNSDRKVSNDRSQLSDNHEQNIIGNGD